MRDPGRDWMQKTVSLTVNGKPVSATVEGRTLLVQLLSEQLGLTGTHVGCDTSQCGACVVHVDGEAVKACTLLAVQADGHSVLTIEGVATGDTLHPMQEAFRNNHALQCGFCTPGMVMSALDLVKNNPNPTEREIREYLEGNLCRCTGYHNFVLAIAEGAAAEIALEIFADLALGRVWVVLDQVERAHDHAVRAAGALQRVVVA